MLGGMDWELAALIASVALGVPTLYFVWHSWHRQRHVVRITIREPGLKAKRYEPLMGDQLTLIAEFRALRNDTYIHGTALWAGKQRVSGRDAQGDNATARLAVGSATIRYWPATDLRHLPARKKWQVCWYDAEDNRRCEDVPRKYAEALVAYRMEAERAGGTPQ